jgi:hypothetical protein
MTPRNIAYARRASRAWYRGDDDGDGFEAALSGAMLFDIQDGRSKCKRGDHVGDVCCAFMDNPVGAIRDAADRELLDVLI